MRAGYRPVTAAGAREVRRVGGAQRVDDRQQQVGAYVDRLGCERDLEVERAEEGLGVARGQEGVTIRGGGLGRGGRHPSEPRLDDPQRHQSAAQHGHRGPGEPVGLPARERGRGLLEHPVGQHVEHHGELVETEMGRVGQHAERVGAVGDRVCPAAARHEAAHVAFPHQPAADPVAPLQDLARGEQRAPRCPARCTPRARARRSCAGTQSRCPTRRAHGPDPPPSRHPAPRAGRRTRPPRPRWPGSGRRSRRGRPDRSSRASWSARQ